MPRADAERLRRQYPVFEYSGFDASPSAAGLDIRFRFRIPPDLEFFYVNELLPPRRDFVAIVDASGARPGVPWQASLPRRALVPVGGGRDSVLAGTLIKRASLPARVMLLNPRPSADAVATRLDLG